MAVARAGGVVLHVAVLHELQQPVQRLLLCEMESGMRCAQMTIVMCRQNQSTHVCVHEYPEQRRRRDADQVATMLSSAGRSACMGVCVCMCVCAWVYLWMCVSV